MSKQRDRLPQELLTSLEAGVPVLLITTDAEGFPHTAFSFASTTVDDQVFIVVDQGSSTESNIARDGRVSIQVLAPGNRVYLVKGRAQPGAARMESSPVPARRTSVAVTSVKNQAWPEIAVAPLTYQYSEQARARWEPVLPRIYKELRG